MDATLAALLGAIIGGMLSVLASWLAQRVQSTSQWLSAEVMRRQHLYSEFVEAAACSFGDALQQSDPDTERLANLYGELGRMRLVSSEPVLREANKVVHRVLATYTDVNRSRAEVVDFLAHDSIDLFSDFGNACRAELVRLQPMHLGIEGPLTYRLTPTQEEGAAG